MQLNNGLELKPHRENERFSIGVSHPLIASPTDSLTVGTRLYGVNDKTRFQLVVFPLTLGQQTDIRALAFEGDWSKADTRQLRILSAGVYQGINGLGAKTQNDYEGIKPDLDFLAYASAECRAISSSTTGKAWLRARSTGVATYWPTASAPSSAGKTLHAATPMTRRRRQVLQHCPGSRQAHVRHRPGQLQPAAALYLEF